jgi:hypothetical protein
VISWLTSGSGWGTREQAIPGEWAALVLIMVLGALLGLLVLWFTVLRHERTVRHRAARRPDGLVAFAGIGPAADEEDDGSAGDATDAADAEDDADAEVDEGRGAGAVDKVDDAGGADGERAAGEVDEEAVARTPEQSAQPSAAAQPARGVSAKRKLTDEILSRVETALAERGAPHWKELAELVHREFGVSVHPSSIQKAVKRRRLAAAQSGTDRMNRTDQIGQVDRMGQMDETSAAADGAGAAAGETGRAGGASGARGVSEASGAHEMGETGGVGGARDTGSAARTSDRVGAHGAGATEPVLDPAAPAPASSADVRVEAEDDVRPNGGRRATSWSSPACPAGDAG